MTKIIERNTTIPTRKSQIFTTAEDNQSAVDVVVLQGEREMARDNRKLGNFRLEGIRPAPRGVPQIEVTFDIDANGILNVSAKDLDTGKEQKIEITNSTNLDEQEIERMVKEAEQHAEEDRRKREWVETRNALETASYQLEREIGELGDTLPVEEKGRAQQLVDEAKEAIKNEAEKPRLEELARQVGEMLQKIAQYKQQQSAGRETTSGGSTGSSGGSDGDVIDADFNEG
jgi:molecular chaperone DnaK